GDDRLDDEDPGDGGETVTATARAIAIVVGLAVRLAVGLTVRLAVRLAVGLAVGLGALACGGSSGPPPAPVATPRVIPAPPAAAGDLEVARVNGRPVWGSCVAAQARALAGGAARPAERVRAEALDQCVAFELLAQAAEARGLAAAPEVGQAVRTAAVNRLVETGFEQRYRTPADLGPLVDAVMKRNEWRMHIIQLRASTYARFVVPEGAPPEIDARAHALADRLAAELASQTGLYGVHLVEAARRIAAGSDIKLDTADVRPLHQDDLVPTYATALYAIPEVGRISPAVRTQWGWDVVLWTGGIEPRERTRDELITEAFPELRRHQFQLWVNQLTRELGVHIEIDQAQVARLDQEGAP
ncbi:MAG TPA: hypothetical protein VFK02_33815, partial [Kofleriaceae bacterium]|nr:hypothetical protein [Kofleriaceae bacterium]